VDEARRVMSTLEDVFYDVLPGIASRMLVTTWGREAMVSHVPARPNLQIGFWPGGDRDGNPFVTAETTFEVARLLKERVLQRHHGAAAKLARRLTFDGVHEHIEQIQERLRITWLQATGRDSQPAMMPSGVDSLPSYESATVLLDDLLRLRQVVVTEHQGLFIDEVDDFILKVHLFGFYFASLDVRQSSDIFLLALREVVRYSVFGSRAAAR
jgi:phosphoenolpyruvate carboxylase